MSVVSKQSKPVVSQAKPAAASEAMTCEVLRAMCRERGMKVSGTKAELVARLTPVAAADDEVPAASDDEVKVAEPVAQPMAFERLKESVLQLETTDLFKLEKQIIAEIERRAKGGVPKKAGAAGKMNAGCQKYQLWCQFVQAHGIKNGWDAFTYAKRCKIEDEMKTVEVDAEEGVEHEGQYIHRDTVTKQKPNGETLTLSQSMRLAKQYWSAKEKTGTKPELYKEFEATLESGGEIEVVAKQEKPRRTMAQLRDEQTAARLVKEAEHAALMAANKAKREEERKTKAALAAAPKLVKKVVKVEKEWTCADDGQVHEFEHKGVKLYRNFAGEIWQQNGDELGEWVGMWDAQKKCIDETVADPYA